jgi:membrane protein
MLNAGMGAMKISMPRPATSLISYLLVAALFAALYKIVPDVRVKWSDVALGAMLAALLFMIGKRLMVLYFAHTGFGSTYKAAGSPIVVLLWVYYSAQLLFWGAEFSKAYTRTVGSQSELGSQSRTTAGGPVPVPSVAALAIDVTGTSEVVAGE